MKTFKRVLIFLVIPLLIFVAHTLISTGFFRTITPKFDGKILKKITIPGAEDIMVSWVDSFALISSTDRRLGPGKEEKTGGLYLIDLKTPDFVPILLTDTFDQPFAPHGISYYKKGNNYIVMAINHTLEGHTIEVFELQGNKLTHLKTLRDPSMISPNDLVMIDENRFYFTNDHGYTKGLGKLVEEYTGLALCNVVFFNGTDYQEVANGLAYANGINFDHKRNLLFVASVRKLLVKVYAVKQDGTLSYIETIPCGTGVDNIEFDTEGNLWIGAHPSLLKFNAYASGKSAIAPSEIIKITYRNKGDYSIKSVYVEDGTEMSGATVAATFGNLIFVGNVMDEAFLILERNAASIPK